MRKIRLLFSFYTYFATGGLVISLLCWIFFCLDGPEFMTATLLIKIVTDALISYLIYAQQSNKLYYYYNLHISKTALFAGYYFFDLMLFCSGLWIVHLLQ